MRGTWEQAARRFQGFFKRRPKTYELRGVKAAPVACFLVGDVVKLTYHPTGGEADLEHMFGKSKPKLMISADGCQVFIVGGAYRFGDRGFIG